MVHNITQHACKNMLDLVSGVDFGVQQIKKMMKTDECQFMWHNFRRVAVGGQKINRFISHL